MARIDDIKTLLDITDNSQDAKLALIITAMISLVENKTGYKIEEETITEVQDGVKQRVVLLKWMNVKTLTSVKYDDNGTWADFDADTYDIDKSIGKLYFWAELTRGPQNIQIIYVAGGENVPADLSDAVNQLIIQRYTTAGRGIKSESVDGASVTYGDNIDFASHPVLSQYMRV